MPGKDYRRVASLSDLPPGEMTGVELDDEYVLIANIEGKVCAIANICSHAEAILSDGYLDDNLVECPLHGAVFDVTDGTVQEGPATENLECYAVAVEGQDIYVGPNDN
jgi:nitrite reductase/ring-hydroxylating ferredoxin subunit